MQISKMTTNELKEAFKASYDSVYVSECYGLNDLRIITLVGKELEKRKVKINITTKHKVTFKNVKNKNN